MISFDEAVAKELTTCDICGLDYNESEREPKFLPCGHTFCLNCIEQMSVLRVVPVSCPACWKDIIGVEEAESLPKNKYALYILRMRKINTVECVPSPPGSFNHSTSSSEEKCQGRKRRRKNTPTRIHRDKEKEESEKRFKDEDHPLVLLEATRRKVSALDWEKQVLSTALADAQAEIQHLMERLFMLEQENGLLNQVKNELEFQLNTLDPTEVADDNLSVEMRPIVAAIKCRNLLSVILKVAGNAGRKPAVFAVIQDLLDGKIEPEACYQSLLKEMTIELSHPQMFLKFLKENMSHLRRFVAEGLVYLDL